jgi:hypothetical protein
LTVTTADLPEVRNAVFLELPTHELGVLAVGTRQITKSWLIFPAFVTLKITVPAGILEIFESLNASSDGLPAETVMVVTFAFAGEEAAWLATGSTAHATIAAITPTARLKRAGPIPKAERGSITDMLLSVG